MTSGSEGFVKGAKIIVFRELPAQGYFAVRRNINGLHRERINGPLIGTCTYQGSERTVRQTPSNGWEMGETK